METTAYGYSHFRREVLKEDMAFHGAPEPGQPLPDFDLPTTAGGRVRKSDFAGRYLLLLLGSFT